MDIIENLIDLAEPFLKLIEDHFIMFLLAVFIGVGYLLMKYFKVLF